ncbi:MAG: hypothetical protein K6E96_06940 [Bacteroidales bacterium]|nr:hypothetical protein [Bacteroidales bacterium]
MKNKILVLGLLGLLGLLGKAEAQNAFNMPFSQFGIGSSEQPFNLPMATRMGGVVYTQAGNNYVNPFNPASYGAIEMESFVFDMGINMQLSTLRDRNERLFDSDGNLGYLLVAMPVTRWWKLAGGLMPYSTMDYESVAMRTHSTYDTVKTIYDGTGGVNQVFVGSSFNILKGKGKQPSLQVGFNVNYLTGRLERAISYHFQGNDSTYFLDSRRYKKTSLHNLTFDLGLQLRQPLGNRAVLGLGVVYKPYLDMKVQDMALIYTYHLSDESLVDTIFPARGEDPEFESRLESPHTVGVGLSLELDKRWRVAADATLATWQGMKYTERQEPSIFGNSALRYGTFGNYAVALERMGNMDAGSYWGRISWSVGGHLSHGALRLELGGEEYRLDEWGIGGGLTLPMRKGKSLLTLSAGYSSYGSTDVLQRNTLTFGIAVSSCERWFFKRKYN